MKIPVPLLPRIVRWSAVVAVAGFLIYNSIITVPPETAVDAAFETGQDTFIPDFIGLDKWRHFLAYGTLAYTVAYAVEHWGRDLKYLAAFVFITVAIFGIGIEIGQYFIEFRYFDINDIIANMVGASLVLPWFALRPYLDVRPIGELAAQVSAD